MKKLLIILLILSVAVCSSAGHVQQRLLAFIAAQAVTFDLRAFIGGTSNQSYTNAQVLDTVAEGVIDGSLTVVDTSSGSVKSVDGELELVGDGDAKNTGFVGLAVIKVLGKAMLFEHGANAIVLSVAGFDTSDTLDNTPDPWSIQRRGTFYAFDSALAPVADIIETQTYKHLMILGGYDTNVVPFKTMDTPSDFLFGVRWWIKGGTFSNWTLVWLDSSSSTSTLYPQFNIVDAVDKTTFANILIPEKPLSPSKMFQPRFLATFNATNGTSIRDVYEPPVVNSVSNPGVTALESGGNTWDIQSNQARNTPGMDADVAPDNTCTTDVARTEVNDTSSWTNSGMATFESVTEGGEPNGGFSLHLVADSDGDYAYTTVTTVVGIPNRVTLIYKKNAATDSPRLNIGPSPNTNAYASRSLSATSFSTIEFVFIPESTTSYVTVVESGANDNAEVWIDVLKVEPLILNELFATDDLGINEGIFDISGTIPVTINGQVGMGLFLDSYTNPQNGILPYYNRLISKAQLFKFVGGVGTSLINVTAAYAANAQLRVIAYRDGSDLLVRLYYNKEFIGTEQRISDAGIVDNTRHGQSSVDTDNRISILSVMPRNDPAWDIEIRRATGGLISFLWADDYLMEEAA